MEIEEQNGDFGCRLSNWPGYDYGKHGLLEQKGQRTEGDEHCID